MKTSTKPTDLLRAETRAPEPVKTHGLPSERLRDPKPWNPPTHWGWILLVPSTSGSQAPGRATSPRREVPGSTGSGRQGSSHRRGARPVDRLRPSSSQPQPPSSSTGMIQAAAAPCNLTESLHYTLTEMGGLSPRITDSWTMDDNGAPRKTILLYKQGVNMGELHFHVCCKGGAGHVFSLIPKGALNRIRCFSQVYRPHLLDWLREAKFNQ